MDPTFKYIDNVKYSTKDLKGGYNGNDFLVLDVYLNKEGPPAKIQLPNIIKYHHIVPPLSITTIGYDEWPLSNAFKIKC